MTNKLLLLPHMCGDIIFITNFNLKFKLFIMIIMTK